ncbi:sugar phosphate isomerase/epimerase [Devosia algicola]|uniref:Sugar phosphate isomerase/epimerase n=1 Tax=Devosia algicola TaxID=3026418 RepID=A0ABY7YQA2_9HYPH|nr:sugar phosphate isomerase/epimerase [Devosia algicola]WDR03509.1 sugar phosphate isomerase/epimerase [Devosia algicola]
MKIGFYTSTFNDRPFEEVADFAKTAGFDAIEIDVGGHIKTPDKVADAVNIARERGLYVSSITLFGNQLDPDAAKRRALRSRTHDLAKAISESEVPIFVIFPGHDNTIDEDENYKSFADHANALASANPSLEFAIENWPGPDNSYIAITPEGWQRLLVLVPDRRIGIEFDPSHLIRLGVDPYAAYEIVKDRVKILHGKDTSFDDARLQAVGYYGSAWWRYRLPGSGSLDWARFLKQALDGGFDGTISIEHEDSDFGWPGKDLEARKEGERQALQHLRSAMAFQR